MTASSFRRQMTHITINFAFISFIENRFDIKNLSIKGDYDTEKLKPETRAHGGQKTRLNDKNELRLSQLIIISVSLSFPLIRPAPARHEKIERFIYYPRASLTTANSRRKKIFNRIVNHCLANTTRNYYFGKRLKSTFFLLAELRHFGSFLSNLHF